MVPNLGLSTSANRASLNTSRLCSIFKVCQSNSITNIDVLKSVSAFSSEAMVQMKQTKQNCTPVSSTEECPKRDIWIPWKWPLSPMVSITANGRPRLLSVSFCFLASQDFPCDFSYWIQLQTQRRQYCKLDNFLQPVIMSLYPLCVWREGE